MFISTHRKCASACVGVFLLSLLACVSASNSGSGGEHFNHTLSLVSELTTDLVIANSCIATPDVVCEGNFSCKCPLGFYCDSGGICSCLKSPNQIVNCQEQHLEFKVLDCYCTTYNASRNLLEVGACILNCENGRKDLTDILYHDLSNINTLCESYNRNGSLCGRCRHGNYSLAYSFSMICMSCPDAHWNWFRYIMAAYLPLTFFYIFILFFRINAISSHLHPVIFFSQFFSVPALSRFLFLAVQNRPHTFMWTKVTLTIYGIWNLDFGRPFYSDLCLGIGILPTLALDYAIAVYPLLLMIVTYLLILLYDKNYRVVTIIWRPFRLLFTLFRRNWGIRTSVIDAFATLFLLSNVKFLSVSFDLLVPTQVYHLYEDHYNYTLGLYYAGDIEYFGEEHLPYGILALFILSVFVLLPVLLLAIYPFVFFQRFLNLFPVRWYVLHTFMDAFQGCYKDGTEQGTCDYRWFSAIYVLFRILSFAIYGFTLNAVFFPLCSLFLLLLILLLVVLQPYKAPVAHYTKTNAAFFLLYTMFYVCLCGAGASGTKAKQFTHFFYYLAVFIALVPLFCMLVLVGHWVFSRWKFLLELVRKVRSLRNGYVSMVELDRDEE